MQVIKGYDQYAHKSASFLLIKTHFSLFSIKSKMVGKRELEKLSKMQSPVDEIGNEI